MLPVLSTIAVSSIGVATLDGTAGLDPAVVAHGFADAFRAAAVITLAAALLALAALRRTDVAPGAQPAFAGH